MLPITDTYHVNERTKRYGKYTNNNNSQTKEVFQWKRSPLNASTWNKIWLLLMQIWTFVTNGVFSLYLKTTHLYYWMWNKSFEEDKQSKLVPCRGRCVSSWVKLWTKMLPGQAYPKRNNMHSVFVPSQTLPQRHISLLICVLFLHSRLLKTVFICDT